MSSTYGQPPEQTFTPADGRQDSHERLRKLRKLVRLARTPAFRRALQLRVAAAVEHADVPFKYDFATVIDVGAHHGQFALFAHHRFPRAQLFCFEPQPDAQQIIRRVFPQPGPMKLFDVALGSDATAAQAMHVSRLDDSSSLLPITERYTTAFPGTDEVTSISVPVTRLDDVLTEPAPARPCLLKIDVQGYELEVLRGGERVLRDVDEVFVECSFVELYTGQALAGELIAYLWSKGFRLTGVFCIKRDIAGRCLQADILFERSMEEHAYSDG
jgi:FkbM family methyltransferase